MGVSGRRHIHESEYEEIGPPPQKNISSLRAVGSFGHKETNGGVGHASGPPCDLCGTSLAMVRCHLCSDQIFCLACDDMYHRHPKRSAHQRKVPSY